MKKSITRRDFIKGAAAALGTASLGMAARGAGAAGSGTDSVRGATSAAVPGAAGRGAVSGPGPAWPFGPFSAAWQSAKARVILIRHKDVLDEQSAIDADVLQEMFDQAVAALLDAPDAVAAFKQLVQPGETVGIKTNVWSYLPTPKELEAAIKRRLIDASVAEDRIGLDDHTCRTNPLFVNATSFVNVRPLRTHYLSGMSGCIKNYIMFAESQPALHPDSCADLGSAFNLPQVKGKTRLNVLCCLTPQFHGRGPHHFSRRYVWAYKGLIVGRDPVAVDTIGLRLTMAKRREVLGPAQELPPVPKHIQLADTRHGIGTSDPAAIELVKIGWDEDILV